MHVSCTPVITKGAGIPGPFVKNSPTAYAAVGLFVTVNLKRFLYLEEVQLHERSDVALEDEFAAHDGAHGVQLLIEEVNKGLVFT